MYAHVSTHVCLGLNSSDLAGEPQDSPSFVFLRVGLNSSGLRLDVGPVWLVYHLVQSASTTTEVPHFPGQNQRVRE